jgi:hypothetical protein
VIARTDVQGAVRRLAEAVPVAWRHDPLFRGAAIGAGVTLALLLLRIVGPHDPELDAPATMSRYLPGTGVPALSGPGLRGVPQAPAPPANMPKIAPGHPLGDATVVPTPDSDRFGTFVPGKHP